MTALEKLIKTASMDSAAHYREMAKEAQRELDAMTDDLNALKHYWACNPPVPPVDMKRVDAITPP